LTRVWNTLPAWLDHRDTIGNKSIGFVPTMGALHRGHASLVERCRRENEIVVVSIFVNPSQFNDPNDLSRYPRTLDRDVALLENLGADEIIAPTVAEMYPDGYRLRIDSCGDQGMEAAFRPGFFSSVMTVVLKLLNIVRPDRAYFGEKDYQQLTTIQEMVREFFIPAKIVACPTVREPSGLAESSRNTLLPPGSREKAASLFRVLSNAADVSEARGALESEGFQVDYVEERWGRRFVAVFLDGVRLIDNIPLAEHH
jgi:pantoate--beta-alanine ligase